MSRDQEIRGRDLRAARREAGLSQGHVAAMSGKSTSHISRIESGEREVTPAIINAYEKALNRKIAATSDPASGVTVESVRRRNAIAAIASAFVGAATLEPLAHLLNGLPAPTLPNHVGPTEVAAVEDATDFYTALDLQYGGGLASEIARGSLRWATGLLGKQMTDDTRQGLFSAVASLADRVAWSHYDMGSHGPANRLFLMALDTAAKGDDRNLRGHIMLNYSTQVFDLGHHDDAVEVLRLALGDDRISFTEKANLHAVCARHCGGIDSEQSRQSAQRHLGMAEDALARADTGDAARWARRVTASPGHFDSALGLALFAIGDNDKARDRFTQALSVLGPGRVRTALRCRTRLAVIHMREGATTEAETVARQAMDDARTVRSARVSEDLRMLAASAHEYGLTNLASDLNAGLAS